MFLPLRVLKNFAVVTFLATSFNGPAAAQESNSESFVAYMEGAAKLDAVIDHEQFDLDALAFALALETPQTIAPRVDNMIATQVYAGALRGAEGTLRAASGNSLDQALLLQRLLIDAGQEVRIARTQLDGAAAQSLVAASGKPQRAPALTDMNSGMAALDDMEKAAGSEDILDGLRAVLSGGGPTGPVPETIALQVDRISSALGSALPASGSRDDVILTEARDYFWVQTRLFATDDWQDLHIAFAPEDALVPDSFVADPLPEELVHRVHVVFDLEIREGNKLKLSRLMEDMRIDTMTSLPRPRVLSIIPDGVINGATTIEDAASDSTFYVPLLDGEIAPRAVAFSADGLTVPATDVLQSNELASSIATSTSKLTDALDLLPSLGADEDEAALPPNTPPREVTGLWAQVTVAAPGADRLTFRRLLVDRIGADRRAEGQVFVPPDTIVAEDAILGQWMLMIQTGGVGQAELLATQIDRLQAMLPAVRSGDERFSGLSVSNPAMQALTTALFDTAADAGAALSDGWTYRRGAGVLLSSQTYIRSQDDLAQQSAIDILTTNRRGIGQDGQSRPTAALAAGVAETLAERTLADAIAVNVGFAPTSTDGSWDFLTQTDTLLPITSKSDIPEVTPAVRAAIETELALGNVLAFAQDGPAWWRIDAASGATIGADALGRGGESAEYIMILDAIVTSAFVGYGTASCEKSGGSFSWCAASNIAWGVVGFSIWGVIGKGLETFGRLSEVAAGMAGLAGGAAMSGSGFNPYQAAC
jgi:hypothetical protein